MLSVPSFSTATFVKSSGATVNVGSPSGEINRQPSSAANTLESSFAIINMVSPSSANDIPLSFVTTRTLNVGSYTAVSFTSVAMHSVSQFVRTSQAIAALPSTTETGVEPTFASTVKPLITSSVNGKYVVITEWLQLHYVQVPVVRKLIKITRGLRLFGDYISNHKNYNFLTCDWFKKSPIFH